MRAGAAWGDVETRSAAPIIRPLLPAGSAAGYPDGIVGLINRRDGGGPLDGRVAVLRHDTVGLRRSLARYGLPHRDGIRWARRYPDGDRRIDQTDDGRGDADVASPLTMSWRTIFSVACAVSSSWVRPTAPGVSTAAADTAVPAADRHTATRLRAGGCRSAAAEATVGDRIQVPAIPPARSETGPFPAAYRHRRFATIRRRSSPHSHTSADRLLMPAATIGQAKRHAGHRSGKGSSQQPGWRGGRPWRVRDR